MIRGYLNPFITFVVSVIFSETWGWVHGSHGWQGRYWVYGAVLAVFLVISLNRRRQGLTFRQQLRYLFVPPWRRG